MGMVTEQVIQLVQGILLVDNWLGCAGTLESKMDQKKQVLQRVAVLISSLCFAFSSRSLTSSSVLDYSLLRMTNHEEGTWLIVHTVFHKEER
jgi:hypothetical protein